MRKEAAKEVLSSTAENLLIEFPTGFGKSKLAIDIIAKYKPENVLIVIPRLVLIDTWRQEFTKWKKKTLLKKVTFVTYVSYPKKADKWDMVIYDECHHLSDRCIEALSAFQVKRSILLSATVGRKIKDKLKANFQDLKSFSISARKAMKEDVLPTPKVYLLPLKLDNTVINQTIVKNPKKGNPLKIPFSLRWQYKNVKDRRIEIYCTQAQYYQDISAYINWCKERVFNKIFENLYLRKAGERLKWLSDQKTSLIKAILHNLRDERVLTFCNSIKQTEAVSYYCINSDNKESQQNLEMFNKGEINHISACNMLDEGINLSSCRIGLYASLNSSERMIVQKLGRILRHPEPVIIIPYYEHTRDEEIVNKMCENYDSNYIYKLNNINELWQQI